MRYLHEKDESLTPSVPKNGPPFYSPKSKCNHQTALFLLILLFSIYFLFILCSKIILIFLLHRNIFNFVLYLKIRTETFSISVFKQSWTSTMLIHSHNFPGWRTVSPKMTCWQRRKVTGPRARHALQHTAEREHASLCLLNPFIWMCFTLSRFIKLRKKKKVQTENILNDYF